MVEIIDSLIALPLHIAVLLWYPVSSFISTVLYAISYLWSVVANFFNSVIGIGNMFIDFITNVLNNLIIASWVTVLVLIMTMIILLRLYSFIKGITIFGFRIGG